MCTLTELLRTAMLPIGNTLYVWGGGWNKNDTGAGKSALSFGVQKEWIEFSNSQTIEYNFHKTKYQIHNGLDCSGYIGWLLYNVGIAQNYNSSFVMSSTIISQTLADLKLGSYTPSNKLVDFQCGDIMSTKGHVYIVITPCDDGSILLAHASPPAVQISGTVCPNGNPNSQAITIANEYAKTFDCKWQHYFKDNLRPLSYLNEYNQFRFYDKYVNDTDNLKNLCSRKVFNLISCLNM